MKHTLIAFSCMLATAGSAGAQQQFVSIAGAPCVAPPALHCPDNDCPSDRVINQGPMTEMKAVVVCRCE